MPLTYTLPNDWTNGLLKDSHPDLHSNLLVISLSTMAVGHNKIDPEWLSRVVQRVDAGKTLTSRVAHPTPSEERTFWMHVYNVLSGMTTNAARMTKKDFRATLT